MNLRRRPATRKPLAEVVTHRDNGVTITLTEDGRRTTPHQPHYLCGNTHCYTHMVDEPDPGPRGTACGECFHAWPTWGALRRDARRDRLAVYWRDLTAPRTRYQPGNPDHPDDPFDVNIGPMQRSRWATLNNMIRALFLRARDVTFCPHCIHDL